MNEQLLRQLEQALDKCSMMDIRLGNLDLEVDWHKKNTAKAPSEAEGRAFIEGLEHAQKIVNGNFEKRMWLTHPS